MPKGIVILNDGLGPNKGDQAILQAMVTTLVPRIPDAKVSVLPYSWKFRKLWSYFRTIKQSDLLILGGGQVLHDQTSPSFTLLVLSKVVLACLLKKRMMAYGIGVGPLKTGIGRWVTRQIVNRFETVTVREPASKRELEEVGVNRPPIVVTADASFLLDPAPRERVEEILREEGLTEVPRPLIAIAPRRWFHYHHSLIPVRYKARLWGSMRGEEEFKGLEETLARVADRLISEAGGSILFVPMRRSQGGTDPGQDDDRVAEEILGLMKWRKGARILAHDYPPSQMKGVLGRMDLIVGMRMHSLLLGGAMGVPGVGIGISSKFRPLFEMMGQGAYLIDLQDLREDLLFERIQAVLSEREEIGKGLLIEAERLRFRAGINNDVVLRMLGQGRET
jgi:polysaccharide pyruvyl transferase WcaK-like protein